ncbi:MAG: flavodoxin-dependent (E)-4-hydroxy-3-methylbut-2-enyl-diphosphate synthase [Thermoanaerobacteraceae bacterium]|nr:flavodoxin-dependent (E)-4-hydroxy-3-methylbut-2-enyl-diphosphate synthase [Thermoanaerobacteraceae bacterium]
MYTKEIKIGNITIGNYHPIAIQSMTNTDTRDIIATINQINRLSDLGCDIIRVAVPDEEAAKALKQIKANTNIPLVADIHFNYKLAILSIENGADKIRINPGNIGGKQRVGEIIKAAKEHKIPIRIGVNSGSLNETILLKYMGKIPEALVESASEYIGMFNDFDFDDIVISLKSSDVVTTIESYRMFSKKFSYPLHLGVTESGTLLSGTIKSAIGIGTLLSEGIGDTIRVSLTADPSEEVKIATQILRSLNLLQKGIEIISCPTCGRCDIDIVSLAEELEKRLPSTSKHIKVAVMGCAVNGPGEAKDADIGIAGGHKSAIFIKKGKIIGKISEDKIVETLLEEIDNLIEED